MVVGRSDYRRQRKDSDKIKVSVIGSVRKRQIARGSLGEKYARYRESARGTAVFYACAQGFGSTTGLLRKGNYVVTVNQNITNDVIIIK